MNLRRRVLAAPFVITALSSGCYVVPEPAPAAQQQPAQGGAQPAGSAATQPAAQTAGGAAPAPTVVSNPPPPQSGAAAGAYTPTAEERQVAEQAVGLLEMMAKVAESYPNDCDRAAAELKIVIDKNSGVIAAANKLDGDPARRKWVEDNYGTRMMNAMGKVMPLMQTCKDHAGLKAVFESMAK